MKKLRQDRKAVSTAIVVMLSLVLVVVVVANVVLWNYQMNELDWEKMHEDVAVVDATSIRDVWAFNPSAYALKGSTGFVSGGISNLTSDDGVYMTFRSYYSGTDISDFVDNNTSDIDNSTDKGTHSNFAAEQYGPDSVYDTLAESAAGNTTMTITASWGADVSSGGTKYPNDGSDYVGLSSSSSYRTANKFSLTSLPSGANVIKVEVIFAVSQAGSSSHLTDIHPYNANGQGDPATDSGSNMYTRCAVGTEYVNDDTFCRTTGVKTLDLGSQACTDVMNAKAAVNRFSLGWHEEGDNSAYATLAEYTDATNPPKLRITVGNYQLDLEVQWTNAPYDLPNVELWIFNGTMGSEDIGVDFWNGATWQNLFTDLTGGLNNISVSSYLTSQTFTIRFKGGDETNDTVQDSWSIDATLLHAWYPEYTAEVEFTGPSNTENWIQLNWTVNTAWTAGSVSVTLQLYNYTLRDYPLSGNGYMAYTSNSTPGTDENKSQTINVNPTDFRNATTGYWKIKAKGVRAGDAQFDLRADWIEFRVEKDSGTSFTFKNEGSLTVHLVSLWIDNSTLHQRYDINVFINSGETTTYVSSEASLPDRPYTVKVVTERGNIASHSES